MKTNKNIITYFILVSFSCLSLPIAAFSEDPEQPFFNAVSPMQKGDRAPFEGVLLSKDVAAKLEAERKTMVAENICNAKIESQVGTAKSLLTKKIETLEAKYSALEEKHEKIVEIKDAELDFFRKSYQPPPWYKEPAFLVSIGLISGAGLAIGAAYIVNLVK